MTAVLDARPDVEVMPSTTGATTKTFADPHHKTTLTSSVVTGSASSDRVLVVGSMESAQSGHYQSVVEKQGMGGLRQVEMYMIDRLTDGASSLEVSTYPSAHLILPFSYLNNPGLFNQLNSTLIAQGSLILESPPSAASPDEGTIEQLKGILGLAGFVDIDIQAGGPCTIISAKKAASGSSSSSSNVLPLRRKLGGANGSSAAKKKALWNVTAAQDTPLIDQDALLSEADKQVPLARRRDDCDVEGGLAGGKKKKACKGCTCGLKELEEEDAQQATLRQGVVQLDDTDMDMPAGSESNGLDKTEVTETMVDENGITRVIKRVKVDTSGATSSCGSCFLGDAFRCSSCPYLGLPAFKPGEKVEIPTSMDDDL